MTKIHFGLLAFLCLTQWGCSLLIGNIKPVEEKSTTYGIQDLSKVDPDWVKFNSTPKTSLEAGTPESGTPESGISDVAYQSKKNASIISINSACKNYPQKENTLKELTRELLLGISDITRLEERSLTVSDTPALETTLKGKIDHEEMMLRTVVLHRLNCVYDLMFVARPDHFNANLEDFSRFVSSLRLK